MPIQPVLNKMKDQGVIHVGFQRHTPPFSYSNADPFKPIGYSVDLCHRVIGEISLKLKLGKVKVNPVEVTSSNRLSLLDQCRVDMECGSTSNTLQRQQWSLFSHSIFYTVHRILVKDFHVPTHLNANRILNVAVIEGSTSHDALMTLAHPDFSFNFVGCSSISSAFERFQDDPNIDAMAADEMILKSLLFRSKALGLSLLPNSLGGEPYGFMIRKGDHAFKAEVDGQLSRFFQSDDFGSLYSTWFMKAQGCLEPFRQKKHCC